MPDRLSCVRPSEADQEQCDRRSCGVYSTEDERRQTADSPGDNLLPFISEQKYNVAIKRIFKAAGLKRLVTVINPTTREEEKRVLYEIASSHLARRTFVGNLYKQVKGPNLVGALSAPKEGSRAFARYRAIDDEMKTERTGPHTVSSC